MIKDILFLKVWPWRRGRRCKVMPYSESPYIFGYMLSIHKMAVRQLYIAILSFNLETNLLGEVRGQMWDDIWNLFMVLSIYWQYTPHTYTLIILLEVNRVMVNFGPISPALTWGKFKWIVNMFTLYTSTKFDQNWLRLFWAIVLKEEWHSNKCYQKQKFFRGRTKLSAIVFVSLWRVMTSWRSSQEVKCNVTACQVKHLIDLITMFVLCLIQRDSDI